MGNNMYKIVVDKEECLGCEACVMICPKKVFEFIDDRSAPVNTELCNGCNMCVEACPAGVISVSKLTAVSI
jgi:NAD-dependent dihydropyrimidine dehydrogenase PreA subunit